MLNMRYVFYIEWYSLPEMRKKTIMLFQKAYQYLVVKAVWVEGSVTVWDSKPGDAASQGLVEVPVPDPTKDPKCGCDDWVKTR